MRSEFGLVKVARIRGDYPIGHPAPLHLNCPCGKRPHVYQGAELIRCLCGQVYDREGYVISEAPDAK